MSERVGKALRAKVRERANLFNPRAEHWRDHFGWEGPRILALRATGRATAALLQVNDPRRLAARAALLRQGRFPFAAP